MWNARISPFLHLKLQTPSLFPSSKKHLVFQKQSVSADVQLWPVLLLWCLRSEIIFESLCLMADGLFLVALNLQNANRKIIKCGAVEARCYVDANEGSTTNNVQHVGWEDSVLEKWANFVVTKAVKWIIAVPYTLLPPTTNAAVNVQDLLQVDKSAKRRYTGCFIYLFFGRT